MYLPEACTCGVRSVTPPEAYEKSRTTGEECRDRHDIGLTPFLDPKAVVASGRRCASCWRRARGMAIDAMFKPLLSLPWLPLTRTATPV